MSRYTRPVPADARLDPRSRRARTEPMAVAPLGSGRYAVATEHGSYLVDVPEHRCTCPDHAFRGKRCKHRRRVAIEITEGAVPPPGHVAAGCAVCGTTTFVHRDAPRPHLCDRHALSRGDLATDRETGATVLVVGVSPRRADEVRIESHDCTVAEYETNRGYPPDDPVVTAVFPGGAEFDDGTTPDSLRVYSFPMSRLRRLDAGQA
ncbi:SWIM zinc finger family protein [Haloarchaeobius sp. FL176]|uniref:SWIM zinc finger family protein n=1 Tax=Haloarchaeobius sp. FL176 TaxID=2967129 RepID=UPI00214769B7|nr:SWIM zinc finger family protein [Haloarchaeobius sp. FL176]